LQLSSACANAWGRKAVVPIVDHQEDLQCLLGMRYALAVHDEGGCCAEPFPANLFRHPKHDGSTKPRMNRARRCRACVLNRTAAANGFDDMQTCFSRMVKTSNSGRSLKGPWGPYKALKGPIGPLRAVRSPIRPLRALYYKYKALTGL
jgi:hypothetical protein